MGPYQPYQPLEIFQSSTWASHRHVADPDQKWPVNPVNDEKPTRGRLLFFLTNCLTPFFLGGEGWGSIQNTIHQKSATQSCRKLLWFLRCLLICPNCCWILWDFLFQIQVFSAKSQLRFTPWWTSSLPNAWDLKFQPSHAWLETIEERIRLVFPSWSLKNKNATMSWTWKVESIHCILQSSSSKSFGPNQSIVKRSGVLHVSGYILMHVSCQISKNKSHRPSGQKENAFVPWSIYVPWSKVAILGMVIPPLIGIRNPYNGYINPYYWVDDHPLLYGNNGSWSTLAHMEREAFPAKQISY